MCTTEFLTAVAYSARNSFDSTWRCKPSGGGVKNRNVRPITVELSTAWWSESSFLHITSLFIIQLPLVPSLSNSMPFMQAYWSESTPEQSIVPIVHYLSFERQKLDLQKPRSSHFRFQILLSSTTNLTWEYVEACRFVKRGPTYKFYSYK